jgi:hypothetical protein
MYTYNNYQNYPTHSHVRAIWPIIIEQLAVGPRRPKQQMGIERKFRR